MLRGNVSPELEKILNFGTARIWGRTRSKGFKSQTFLPPPVYFDSNGDLPGFCAKDDRVPGSGQGCVLVAFGRPGFAVLVLRNAPCPAVVAVASSVAGGGACPGATFLSEILFEISDAARPHQH